MRKFNIEQFQNMEEIPYYKKDMISYHPRRQKRNREMVSMIMSQTNRNMNRKMTRSEKIVSVSFLLCKYFLMRIKLLNCILIDFRQFGLQSNNFV